MLRLTTFGKLHIALAGRLLTADLISAKGQALLIYLAVTGQPYSRSALAGLLWGEMPEETARANLRLTLTRLRRAGLVDYLRVSRRAISFRVEQPYWLDVRELEELSFEMAAKQLLPPLLQSLLTLYPGDFLIDLALSHAPGFEMWVLAERERLRRKAVAALYHFARQAAAQANNTTGIEAARRLLHIEPYHEEGHRQLMWLLAASGQRSAALAQYETCRHLLDEELGVAPAAETKALYEQIKNDQVTDYQSVPTADVLPGVLARAAFAAAPPHNLPAQLTPFIGRKAELARLVAHLQANAYRLITIGGEGGVGKTRLALAAAEQTLPSFAGGAWFVSLVGLEMATTGAGADPAAVAAAIATAAATVMDLNFASAESPQNQLMHYLRDKNCLLILDNFEHLLAGAGLVLELLAAVPQLTVLVTSREPLHLPGEYLLRLTGLATPKVDAPAVADSESVQLFAERAEQANGRRVLDAANLPQVVQICRFVGGLPLGIELAAAWTRWLPVADIWQMLQAHVDNLEATYRNIPPRHRTLRATLDVSWELLTAVEQRALAQLSIFRRGFALAAAQAVADVPPPVIFALIDKSLVQHLGEGYYGLHELLRQYAAARLDDVGVDGGALHDRHAAYYLALVGEQESALVGQKPQVAQRRMQVDAENLAAAWAWAVSRPLTQELSTGAGGMAHYWAYAGLFAEGERAIQTAVAQLQPLLDLANPQPELCRLLARLLAERGNLLFELARLDEMAEAAWQSIKLSRLAADAALEGHGRLRLAQVLWRRGDYEAAGDQLQLGQQLVQSAGQTVLEATIWRNWAAVAWRLGDLERAVDYGRRSLDLHRQAGDVRGECRACHFLAILALNRHDYATVQALLLPTLLLAQETGERRVALAVYAELGQAASYQGHFEQALVYFAQEYSLAQELGVRWQIASNLSNSGDLKLRLGDLDGASAHYEQALALFRQMGTAGGESNTQAYRGLLACLAGRYEDGRLLCQAALQSAQQVEARREQAFARLFLAHNLAGLERWAEAQTTYQLAREGWQLLGDRSRAIEAQAGEAQALRASGNMAGALANVAAILAYLESNNLDGADDPGRVYLACYELLAAAQDKRAEMVLANGRAWLQARAAGLQDENLRRSLLENIPSHRVLQSLGSDF